MCQWEKQVEYFGKERGDEFEICIYENRGMSLSDPVAGRWTTSAMARDALSLLDHLNWTKDVHCVGLSMGGMIAQEMCRQGKGRFASLTLISTIAGGLYSLAYFLASIPSGVQLLVRANLASTGRERLRHSLNVMYPSTHLNDELKHPETGQNTTYLNLYKKTLIRRALAEREKGIQAPPLTSVMKQVLAVISHNVPKEELDAIATSVNGNTLVITGDDDILVHSANSVRLHDGLKGRLVWIKGAGHGAFEQSHQQVNAEIERLIRTAREGKTIPMGIAHL